MNGGQGLPIGGGSEVTALAEELARAAELALSPSASQDMRMQAYNACERYVSFILYSVNSIILGYYI